MPGQIVEAGDCSTRIAGCPLVGDRIGGGDSVNPIDPQGGSGCGCAPCSCFAGYAVHIVTDLRVHAGVPGVGGAGAGAVGFVVGVGAAVDLGPAQADDAVDEVVEGVVVVFEVLSHWLLHFRKSISRFSAASESAAVTLTTVG